MTDKERILTNIAAMLATELHHLQSLPEVQRYLTNPHGLSKILCVGGWRREGKPFKKDDLVVCNTSTGRQDNNPWLISFVEQNGSKNDPNGLLLREIGTGNLCDYGNENFIEILGIPERMLWEGTKWQFNLKLKKALHALYNLSAYEKLDTYGHRFRGIKFLGDDVAYVYFGEVFGGLGTSRTKPYFIAIPHIKKTRIKTIISLLVESGFGTRKFEPDDGTDTSPYGNPQPITRESLIGDLQAAGIELRPEVINGRQSEPTV